MVKLFLIKNYIYTFSLLVCFIYLMGVCPSLTKKSLFFYLLQCSFAEIFFSITGFLPMNIILHVFDGGIFICSYQDAADGK